MAVITNSLLTMMGWNHTGDWGPYTFYTKPNRTTVFYLRAPPKGPPSRKQSYKRARFGMAAEAWSRSTAATRASWNSAADLAKLRISGINLWMYYQLTKDVAAIQTVERHSGVQLLP